MTLITKYLLYKKVMNNVSHAPLYTQVLSSPCTIMYDWRIGDMKLHVIYDALNGNRVYVYTKGGKKYTFTGQRAENIYKHMRGER